MSSKKIFFSSICLGIALISFFLYSSNTQKACAYDQGGCANGQIEYTGPDGPDLAPGFQCGDAQNAAGATKGYVYGDGQNGALTQVIGGGYCCSQGTPAPTTPPHQGYDLGTGCNSNSICYTGQHAGGTLIPGEQCGNLPDWHYGSDGNNVPSCSDVIGLDGAVCCDPGPALASPIPPNICPSQNGVCQSVDTALGTIDVNGISPFISRIFSILLSVSGGIAIILIILSGYRIMVAQGDPEKLKGAREMLTSSIVGLLFIIFSVTILTVIGFNILHIPGFK